MSYWSGAARRLLPALVLGLVVGVAGLLVGDWRTAVLVGGVTILFAVLLPTGSTEEPPAGAPPLT